jgi:uncharacterized membrane protein
MSSDPKPRQGIDNPKRQHATLLTNSRYIGCMANRRSSLRALGIGFAAGLRSMTAPAAVSWGIANRRLNVGTSLLSLLGSERGAQTTAKLALGEIVADKTRFVPSRLKPASLSWRLTTGALCGAAVSLSAREDGRMGAALGAAGALTGSLLGYLWRREGAKQLNAPDVALALLEDAAAIGIAWAAVSWPSISGPLDAWADDENPAWLP